MGDFVISGSLSITKSKISFLKALVVYRNCNKFCRFGRLILTLVSKMWLYWEA